MDNKKYPLLSRREIEGLIADGHHVFILNQLVIKADAWIPYHPGGDKAILHMVGRDATDEVTALHSAETKQRMRRFCIGRIEGRWDNATPPIQGGKFHAYVEGDDFDTSKTTFSSSASPSSSSTLSLASGSQTSDSDDDGLTHRKPDTHVSISSPTLTPSVDDEDDGMAHLDTITREKITLDLDKYPSLDPSTQEAIIQKYRLLRERIVAEGLFGCNYQAYGIEMCRYSFLLAGMLIFLRLGWYPVSAMFLGALWHLLSFVVHDAGHIGITQNFHVDSVIGIVLADFLGGLSLGWWKRSHNIHHIVTNSPEHDPDIEYLPFFAVSHRFLGSIRSTYYDRLMKYDAVGKILVRIQQYSYYPIMLFARFNLYRLSWEYLLKGQAPQKGPAWWHRHLELAGQVFFWTWFGYGLLYKTLPTNRDRFLFLVLSNMFAAPLHVQITLSHFAMSTADLGPIESFPQKMLRTTMDVDCPPWIDFFHGGLQFQAIHHLFPRIPRHNLRRTQKLVQEFCNDVGIPYALYGFVDGNKQVIGSLAEVARQAAILAKCQKAIAKSGDLFHAH